MNRNQQRDERNRREDVNNGWNWKATAAVAGGLAALAGGYYLYSRRSEETQPQAQGNTDHTAGGRRDSQTRSEQAQSSSSSFASNLLNTLERVSDPSNNFSSPSRRGVSGESIPENPSITNMDSLLHDIYLRFIALNDDDFEMYYNVMHQIFLQLHSKMKDVDPYYNKYSSQVQFAGSHPDRLRINKPDEFDIDIVIGLPLCMKYNPLNPEGSDIQIEPNYPGFVQLKMGEQFKRLPYRDGEEWQKNRAAFQWKDDSDYLLRSKFSDWFKSVVNKALNEFKENSSLPPVFYVQGVPYSVDISESGPARTMYIKNDAKNFKLDVDLVPALRFPIDRWPVSPSYRSIPPVCCGPGREYWMVVPKPNKGGATQHDAKRSWRVALHQQESMLMHDTNNMRQAIRLAPGQTTTARYDSGQGCPSSSSLEGKRYWRDGKPNKGGAKQHIAKRSWRVALHQQESMLLHDTNNMRQAIRLLKKLRDAQNMNKICSYYIKTMFFWEAMEHQTDREFWNQSPLKLFKIMMKNFHRYLIDGKIPYFWNKNNNLIAGVKREILDRYTAIVEKVLEILDRPTEYKQIARYLLTPEEFKYYNEQFLHI